MKNLLVILCFIFCFSDLFSQSIYRGKGKVSFISEAPLELIQGDTDQLNGIVDISNRNFAFKVSMNSFTGFNSALQREHFNEHYLETQKYPDATFLGTMLIKDDCTNGCITEAVCKGKFSIHGVTQIVTIPVILNLEEGTIKIIGEFKIKLSEYNIKIPKIVQAKIASEVLVKINVMMSEDL